MSTKEFTGWVSKQDSEIIEIDTDETGQFPMSDSLFFASQVYVEKGTEKDWNDFDWPPKKVKITVEVED